MENVCESFRKKCHLLHYAIVKFKPNLNESLVWVWILSQLFYVELYASLANDLDIFFNQRNFSLGVVVRVSQTMRLDISWFETMKSDIKSN